MKLLTIFVKSILLLNIPFYFLSCSGRNADNQKEDVDIKPVVMEFPVTIPFETGIETEREILLSEIARDVKIVPLETKPECLVAKVNRGMIQMMDHNLYIVCSEGLLQFTEDGKFVRSIAKKGQGPGEYSAIRDVTLNDRNKEIHLMDHAKIHVYSADGTFLRENRMTNSTQFILLGDSTYVGYVYNNTGQKKNRLILSGLNGDTIRTFPQFDQFTIESGMNYYLWGRYDRYLYSFEDDVCCKEYYNDTVFTVTSDRLQPRYILNLGKYKIPKEKRFEVLDGNWQEYSEPARAYLRPDFLETSSWVFMPYTSWDVTNKDEVPQLAMYNKGTDRFFKVKDNQIKNDIKGQLPFYPAVRIADDILLYYWEAADILELAEQNPSILKDERLRNLKYDDNPVLMLVYLKRK